MARPLSTTLVGLRLEPVALARAMGEALQGDTGLVGKLPKAARQSQGRAKQASGCPTDRWIAVGGGA
jgi:hypothetical protein